MWTTSMLVAAVLTSGLSAGLFTAFSYAVMPGLARSDDPSFVSSMRGINVAILNPVFLVVFLGPLLFGAIASIAVLWRGETPTLAWTLVGLALYVAQVAVTAMVNVPLNNALDSSDEHDPATSRRAFEARWNRSNLARSVVSTAAFGCFVGALWSAA